MPFKDSIDLHEAEEVEAKPDFKPWLEEFKSSDQEARYRLWAMNDDKWLVRGFIVIAILVMALFIVTDSGLHELEFEFQFIFFGRIVLLSVFVYMLYLINRSISIKLFDFISSFLFISLTIFELFIVRSLPSDFFNHVGVDMLLIFLVYLASPISIQNRLAISITFTTGLLLLLFTIKEPTYNITYVDYSYSIIIPNIMGYWISVHYGRVRRTSYQYLINERKARDEIQTLKGIIPICSYCKNIRSDEGSWEQLESYMKDHSDAEFSHGICPDCLQQLRIDHGLDKTV